MNIEKRTIQVTDGTTIYYEVAGSGQPLFLLHGNGGSSAYFQKQIPTFSQYFTVYAIDSRGHGRSTNTSETLTFQQMAQDLKELIDYEKLAMVDIVGFSDGANLAMVFTATYPALVHRLVLNAGNTTFTGVKFFIRIATYLQYFFWAFLAWFSQRAKPHVLMVKLLLRDIGISEKQLTEIQCETLVIVGKYDVIKQSHSIWLVDKIPHASFVLVPHQGHSFARKDPETFNHEILSFLIKKSR